MGEMYRTAKEGYVWAGIGDDDLQRFKTYSVEWILRTYYVLY